jgi:RNA polymerase sigma factor (sigma-70 family)
VQTAPNQIKDRARASQAYDRSPDFLFVQRVLTGDERAAFELRSRYDAQLKSILCKRGASNTEAEDLVADLWADCFGSSGPPLLKKYEGRCALSSWLFTVATNRFIDFKRRQAFRGELSFEKSLEIQPGDTQRADYVSLSQRDDALILLLRCAISNAFASQSPETCLMLRLVHVYDVTQREIGRMWNWHESKVSRTLNSARATIKDAVLGELRRADPWLTLEWADFVELAKCLPEVIATDEKKMQGESK